MKEMPVERQALEESSESSAERVKGRQDGLEKILDKP